MPDKPEIMIMWKEFGDDPDGIVFWACLLGGLVFLAASTVYGQ